MFKIFQNLKKIVLMVGVLSLVTPHVVVAMDKNGDLEMSLLTRRASSSPALEDGDSKAHSQPQPQFHSAYDDDPDGEESFCGNYGAGRYCFAFGVVGYFLWSLIK